MEEYYIGQKFYGIYPPEAAVWCNQNNAMIVKMNDETETVYYEIVEIPEPPAPTHEEVRQMRERAYQEEVDPITCHINRLRDEEQTPEIEAEITDLIAERTEKVAAIKEQYPYPLDIEE